MKHIKLFEQQNSSLIDNIESEISEFNKILEMEGVIRGLNISLNIIRGNE